MADEAYTYVKNLDYKYCIKLRNTFSSWESYKYS